MSQPTLIQSYHGEQGEVLHAQDITITNVVVGANHTALIDGKREAGTLGDYESCCKLACIEAIEARELASVLIFMSHCGQRHARVV